MAEWRDLVGGFILAFGDIELISFHLWREHVRLEPVPHHFTERTGRVLSALRRLGDEYALTVKLLEASLKLASKRNTIAHSPMRVQIFEHSNTGEVLFEQAITSETTDEYIDDAALKELRAEAEDLAAQLYIGLGYPEPQTHRTNTDRDT